MGFGSSVAVSEFWDVFLSVWCWQQGRVVRKCHGKCLDKEHVFLGVLVLSVSPGTALSAEDYLQIVSLDDVSKNSTSVLKRVTSP